MIETRRRYRKFDPAAESSISLTELLDLHTRVSGADLMQLVGLDPALLQRRPQGLGAGALSASTSPARACNRSFIVLDELTSALSPQARAGLIQLLGRLQEELSISYLFITHDLTSVPYVCHRAAVMYLGQIVEEGSVEEIFRPPRHPYS
jgi:peptide/nickel transport system ATP-binding protein